MDEEVKKSNKKPIIIVIVYFLAIVILMGMIYSYLLEEEEPYYTGGRPIYSGSISGERDNTTGNNNWTIRVISCSGRIKTNDLNCYLKDEEGKILIKGEPITHLSDDIIFDDYDYDGNLTKNDTFYILGEPYGIAGVNYTFSLIYTKQPSSHPVFEDVVLN